MEPEIRAPENIFAKLYTLLQAKSKIRNPAKKNKKKQLDNCSLTLDGVMAPSPIFHPFPFKMLFSQTLFIDFKIISRHWLSPLFIKFLRLKLK